MTNGPGAVVQPDRDGIQSFRVDLSPAREGLIYLDRAFAKRDSRNGTMMRDGFRDEINRIGIVEEVGLRTDRLHIRNDLFDNSDRAQSHKESPWPLCLLANDSIFERNAL